MKSNTFLLLLLSFIVLSCQVRAQTGAGSSQLNNRQQKLYEQIRSANNRGALEEALEGLDKLLADAPDFTEGYYMRGVIQYDLRAFEAAITDLKKVLQLQPDHDPLVLYQLALAEKGHEQYDAASAHLEQFLAKGYKREAIIERAKKHLEDTRFAAEAVKHPLPFKPEKIEAPVSSADSDYLPVLSADAQTLVFTRMVGKQEDLFTAERTADGKWGAAQPMQELNGPFNEAAQSISADGRLMVFTRCQSGPDQGGCDIFYSEKCAGSWSAPQRIAGEVNTTAWEAQPALSADGNLLLFSSNRPGGLGGNDIWAARRSRSGKWGKPVNLGAAINTPGNDQSPFLHADGRTLYFSSDGRPGMGDVDLYYVQLQEDGQWGEVRNLGYPINTVGHEGALCVSLDGSTAFFAKSTKEMQDLDIFTFPMPAEVRPFPVTYIKGSIFDEKTGKKLSARAELFDVDAGRPVAVVPSCEDGSYLVCLPAGKNYALNVNKEGYLFFSEHFALKEGSLSEPLELDVPLQAIEEPAVSGAGEEEEESRKPVVLKNVFFATASAELLPASTIELDRLFDLLQENPGLRIQINGHTDHVGGDEENLKLSEARAKAVYAYLLEKGIAEDRLRYKGFGETRPMADNENAEGRQLNRRTEFEILKS